MIGVIFYDQNGLADNEITVNDLLAALGAWFGWQALPVIILTASLIGTGIAVLLMLFRGHNREVPIAFGPYLALGGWIFLMWGEWIMRAYFGALGF